MIIKTPDQNRKKQRRNLANNHCQAITCLRLVNNSYIRLTTKQYCQATFHGDKKNDKKNCQEVYEKGTNVSGNTLAPFTRFRCYLKTKIFYCCLIWYVLFCFLRFGLSMTTVYPVTTVTENASYQNATQRGDLNTFASRLRAVDGRKQRFSNTMKSYIIYHENYACSVRDVFVFPSFF